MSSAGASPRRRSGTYVLPLELALSLLLRGGVLLCAGTIALGLLLMLLQAKSGVAQDLVDPALLRHPRTGTAMPANLAAMVSGLSIGSGASIIALGLALLIALPILRVALACVAFARERDRTYVALTLIVLAILATGMLLGRAA